MLNTKRTEAGYYIDSKLPEHTNRPQLVIKNKWNSMPNGDYILKVLCGGAFIAIVQKLNDNYGSIMYWNYSMSSQEYAIIVEGKWSK